MKVLVSNVGSSSFKYQIIDMKDENTLAKGYIERVGKPPSIFTHSTSGKDKINKEIDIPNHNTAIKVAIDTLLDKKNGILSDLSELSGVGFKAVFAKDYISSAVIDENVIKALEEYIPLAPFHNPAYIASIRAFQEILPQKPLVAVFETWFHETIPDYAYIFSVPYGWLEKYGVRRYGFHGASHRYISQRTPQFLGLPADKLKIISCHLGGSSSICAIKHGKSIDTSMGFSAQSGVMQSTRCGDIDPFLIPFIMDREGLDTDQIRSILSKESGMLGISGVGSDMRDLLKAIDDGNKRALLTVKAFHYSIKKYIGAYASAMGGLDTLVFTGGIGERSIRSRAEICEDMEFLGIKIDTEKNKSATGEMNISSIDSKVQVLVIPTNEEIIVARETARLINAKPS
ncbi:TPA: acetate kinase [bacterium]|nr:acetate kinase [bacterium]